MDHKLVNILIIYIKIINHIINSFIYKFMNTKLILKELFASVVNMDTDNIVKIIDDYSKYLFYSESAQPLRLELEYVSIYSERFSVIYKNKKFYEIYEDVDVHDSKIYCKKDGDKFNYYRHYMNNSNRDWVFELCDLKQESQGWFYIQKPIKKPMKEMNTTSDYILNEIKIIREITWDEIEIHVQILEDLLKMAKTDSLLSEEIEDEEEFSTTCNHFTGQATLELFKKIIDKCNKVGLKTD